MNEAVRAMQQLSEAAQKNGTSEMTLDEINAEIQAVRAKVKGQNVWILQESSIQHESQ